jgi:CheY-like chemotaxis protein
VLTALVVDDQSDARRRVAGLLRLGGWQVREAAGADDALRQAAADDPDLVVTDVEMPGQSGPSMLRRLRHEGSRARFVVVTSDPTPAVRAEAKAAGALATLAKPVEARVLLDFLRSRTTGPTAQDDSSRSAPVEIVDGDDLHDDDLDAELMERLQDMYADALPARLAAIAAGTRAGDTVAVASAAHTLAGTSGQLGHPEVAEVCRSIAADARRGVLAHAQVVQLRSLCRPPDDAAMTLSSSGRRRGQWPSPG